MRTTRRVLAWLICLAAVAAGGGTATAAESKDVLELRALTWNKGGDVRITVLTAEGGATIARFEHVYIRLTPPGETEVALVLNCKDVAAKDGVAGLARSARFGNEARRAGARPAGRGAGRRSCAAAIAKLRPDLVVAAVHAPAQTLSSRPVDVVADLEERNGQAGATATLTLMLGPTPVAEPKTVTVQAGASTPVTFADVKLATATTTS